MKAWRLLTFGDHRLVEVPLPKVEDRFVLVKVKVVQPSITDTETLKGVNVASTLPLENRLAEGKPIQKGHECCGEVVEIGKGVSSLQVGDRVSPPGEFYCGSCSMCLSGRNSECLSPYHLGVDIFGAFAEYICLPEWGVVKIPDGPTDNEVAALQPIASAMSSVEAAQIRMGDTVVVLGQGTKGLGVLQAAKLVGAGLLVAVAKRAESLALSKKYGANIIINTTETDVVEQVRQLTGGSGADIVFDAAGGSPSYGLSGFETVRQAFRMVRSEGKVIQSAHLVGTMEWDTVLVRSKKIRYINPRGATTDSLKLAAFWLASGRIQVGPQITHILHGLEKLPEAIEITVNKAKYGATNSAQIVL